MALAWMAWVCICVVWGTTYLAIRIALETLPPALMGAMRWIVAAAILAIGLWVRREAWPPLRQWPGFALGGLLLIGLGNGGVIFAEQFVPSGLAAVIVATVPFWMVGVEAVVPSGERITQATVTGLVVGFAGIVLLVWPELRHGGGDAARFAWGVVALQVACAGWAVGSTHAKRHALQASVVSGTTLQMLFGGVLMLIVGVAAGELNAVAFSPRSTAALVYLVLAGSVGGFLAYTYALRHLPISTVSLYAYVNPVIAVVLGAAVLGEPLGARIAVATALVLLGSAIVRVSAGARGLARRPDAGATLAGRLARAWRRGLS
jgi:drug/metabolite transporter (DMT)-like permease